MEAAAIKIPQFAALLWKLNGLQENQGKFLILIQNLSLDSSF